MSNIGSRKVLLSARRIVVKIGSRVLVNRAGRPDLARMKDLARQLSWLHKSGREIVVVSSGAIGAGMEALGIRIRPTNLPDLQMAAAVGQSRLMAAYDKLFSARGCKVGQILLTHDDLRHRLRHLNARNTMMNLLRHRIIPIVNENDVVAVEEIKFGDNDLLASLVALLVEADALILLTTVDGLRAPMRGGRTRRISLLHGISDETIALASGKGGPLSTGGMASKLQSAAMVVGSGTPVVIANGRGNDVLVRVFNGADVGTFVQPVSADGSAALSHRERWISFFHKPKGALVVDDGAREAILQKGRSLLPIGVREVEGAFEQGDVVSIRGLDGNVIAHGLTEYGSNEARIIKGRRTAEIARLLGSKEYDEIIHRDNMVFSESLPTKAAKGREDA